MTGPTVISAYYPPNIDASRTPLAFGRGALPRLNKELQDGVLLTRQRAVNSLSDYLHDPEHIAEAIRVGIVGSLKKLLLDPDVCVRQKCTECFYIIAGYAIGRDAYLNQGVIPSLSDMWDDPDFLVRLNSHTGFFKISETPLGAAGIVDANLVPKLVEKLKSEIPEIKTLILDTLHFCMLVSTAETLQTDAMATFTLNLNDESPQICSKAARDIMNLSVTLEGKNSAVNLEAVPKLVKLLKNEDADVRAACAAALMSITITTLGKYTAIKSGALLALLPLVDDDTSEVRVNALKTLTCLAEAPEGRRWLLETGLEQVEKRMEDPIPAVQKHATIASNVIRWKP